MTRWIALGAFLALAALMLLSGFAAVHTLDQMHLREELVRRAFATRTRVFTDLVIAVASCHAEIPRTTSGEPDPEMPKLLDQMAAQVDAGLTSYNSGPFDEERGRLHKLGELVKRQKSLYDTVFAWTPEERKRQGPAMIDGQIMPLHQRMIDWATQAQVWNTEQLKQDDNAVVAQLAATEGELSRILWVALGSGLLLIAASLAYMVRMEKQARMQVAELSGGRRD